jgi:hypothetical protein
MGTKIMGLFQLSKQGMAVVLCGQLVLATQSVTLAQAEMLSTDAAISKYTALSDRTVLMDELQRDAVQEQIVAMGIDPAEAAARLAALSDTEVASILTQIENDNAGADIIGTLFTVFIILLVTDLLCFTSFFNFTRCVR